MDNPNERMTLSSVAVRLLVELHLLDQALWSHICPMLFDVIQT